MSAFLRGALAADARAAVDELGRGFLALRLRKGGDASLGSGAAGVAVVHTALSVVRPREGHERAAEQALGHAVDALVTGALPPTLYSGSVGVAWTLQALVDRGDDAEGDDLDAFDTSLAELIERGGWSGSYDLVKGLVGVGVYALERLPRASAARLVAAILDQLEATAVRRRPGLAWRTRPEWTFRASPAEPFPEWNLGVSHGVPGVIAWLGRVLRAPVSERVSRRARVLLDGAVAWLLSQRLPDDAGGAFAWAAGEGLARERTRTAWCYGDPGVSAALLVAARAARVRAWERASMEVARLAAGRVRETGAVDAAFCHGAAGLGHVFRALSRATEDKLLARAARAWFSRTLEMRVARGGFGGFRSLVPVGARGALRWRAHHGLLGGAGGIALALAAALAPRAATPWERLFLLP
jgi:hypothetical protein